MFKHVGDPYVINADASIVLATIAKEMYDLDTRHSEKISNTLGGRTAFPGTQE